MARQFLGAFFHAASRSPMPHQSALVGARLHHGVSGLQAYHIYILFFHQQMTQPSEITILASYLQRTLEAERMTRLVINSVQINAHTSLMPPSSLSPKPLGYSRLRTRVNAGVSTLAPWLLWVYGWLCQFWPQNPSFLESMVLWS